jgi:hypothetical protein
MNNTVAVTNSNATIATGPGFQNGDTIQCNDYKIGPFSNTSVTSNVVTAFNQMSQFTGVMATEANGYMTLQSIDPTSQMITLSDFAGSPLEQLGLTYGTDFYLGNPIYGSGFGTITSTNVAVINGTSVTFTGATQADVITNLNNYQASTNVLATPCGSNIQLNSFDGSPIYFGVSGPGVSAALGFADSTAYGGNMTVAQALLIEQANMMWKGMITQVETILSPIYWGSIVMTGNNVTDGSTIPATLTWTIGISNPDVLTTITVTGEPEGAGTTLYGITALLRLMARGLAGTYTENRKVYNNNVTIRGSFACRENPVYVPQVTAYPIDITANLNTIASNFTVTQIGYT